MFWSPLDQVAGEAVQYQYAIRDQQIAARDQEIANLHQRVQELREHRAIICFALVVAALVIWNLYGSYKGWSGHDCKHDGWRYLDRSNVKVDRLVCTAPYMGQDPRD